MIIPWKMIAQETLQNLVETMVSSEGTDNGNLTTMDEKVDEVMKQLTEGIAIVTFDELTDSFSIKLKESVDC